MRLSMMVTVVLATIVIAGCASQPASVVSSAGIESLTSPAEETSWWRLLLTSHPPHYSRGRNNGSSYYPPGGESGVYRTTAGQQNQGYRSQSYGGSRSVDSAHHSAGHTHHHGHN